MGPIIFFSGVCSFLLSFFGNIAPTGVWSVCSGARNRKKKSGHFGPKIQAWLLRVLAGWLAGRPAGRPELLAGWLTGWLNGTGSLDSPGQLGFGTHFFCFPGLLVFESGASALGRDTGHTLDPLWAQDLSLAAPGPGWLAGRLAGRAAEAAGWVADWLAEWLAVCLLGLSWTARLWEPLFFFRGGFLHTNQEDN